jgi:hypothetical protein
MATAVAAEVEIKCRKCNVTLPQARFSALELKHYFDKYEGFNGSHLELANSGCVTCMSCSQKESVISETPHGQTPQDETNVSEWTEVVGKRSIGKRNVNAGQQKSAATTHDGNSPKKHSRAHNSSQKQPKESVSYADDITGKLEIDKIQIISLIAFQETSDADQDHFVNPGPSIPRLNRRVSLDILLNT